MPAGGELAALFARRNKVDDDDNSADKEEPTAANAYLAAAAATAAKSATARGAAPAPTVASRLPPRSSPPSTPSRPPMAPPPKPKKAARTPPPAPQALVPSEEPVKATATPAQHVFDERNLEAGIPTPSFLINARKGLKKKGEKPTSVGGYSVDSDVNIKGIVNQQPNQQPNQMNAAAAAAAAAVGSSSSGLAKSSSFSSFKKITVGKNHSSGSDNHKKDEQVTAGAAPSPSRVFKSNSFTNSSQSQHGGGAGRTSKKIINNHKQHNIFRSASTCSSSNHDAPLDEKLSATIAATATNNAKSNNGKKNHSISRSNSESFSDATSNNGKKNHSISRSNSDSISARRTRMVASRGASVSSASSLQSSPNPNNEDSINEAVAAATSMMTAMNTTQSKKSKKTSPAHLRRDKLLARVRNSHVAPTSSTAAAGDRTNSKKQPQSINSNNDVNISIETDSAISFDAPQTAVISPKTDEFEVLFADDDSSPNPQYSNVHVSHNESIDSIANEILMQDHNNYNTLLNDSTGTTSTSTTLPTNNAQPRVKISMTKNGSNSPTKKGTMGNSNVTPEKVRGVNSQQSRLHNASTPKIRGNSNYRRDKNESGSSGQIQSSHIKQPQHHPLQSYQEHEEEEEEELTDDDDFLPHDLQQTMTPRRMHHHHDSIPHQPYPLRQSPSQMSQMSGITTPSCFPQEFQMTPTGHLQQPLLVGGPILENASSHNSVAKNNIGGGVEHVGGAIVGSSAFSPGMEAENRRLREQLGSTKKRLEEKDAIISQLMKRIGDLETMNSSAARGEAQAHRVNKNTSFAKMESQSSPHNNHGGSLLNTPSTVSTSLHSASGARSSTGNSNSDSYAMSSLWDHSQPAMITNRALSSNNKSSAFHQPALSQSSNSVDTESAYLSISHPPPQQSQQSSLSKLQQQAHKHKRIRSNSNSGSNMKASPNTITTSPTASVTTANSSKSGVRSNLSRSKSVSLDTNRRSPHRRSGGGSVSSTKQSDDRKFAC